jgi:hypothetical protein
MVKYFGCENIKKIIAKFNNAIIFAVPFKEKGKNKRE